MLNNCSTRTSADGLGGTTGLDIGSWSSGLGADGATDPACGSEPFGAIWMESEAVCVAVAALDSRRGGGLGGVMGVASFGSSFSSWWLGFTVFAVVVL